MAAGEHLPNSMAVGTHQKALKVSQDGAILVWLPTLHWAASSFTSYGIIEP